MYQAQVQVPAMGVLINGLKAFGALSVTVAGCALKACVEFLGCFVFCLVVGALGGGR